MALNKPETRQFRAPVRRLVVRLVVSQTVDWLTNQLIRQKKLFL